jgi:hypothetical protein
MTFAADPIKVASVRQLQRQLIYPAHLHVVSTGVDGRPCTPKLVHMDADFIDRQLHCLLPELARPSASSGDLFAAPAQEPTPSLHMQDFSAQQHSVFVKQTTRESSVGVAATSKQQLSLPLQLTAAQLNKLKQTALLQLSSRLLQVLAGEHGVPAQALVEAGRGRGRGSRANASGNASPAAERVPTTVPIAAVPSVQAGVQEVKSHANGPTAVVQAAAEAPVGQPPVLAAPSVRLEAPIADAAVLSAVAVCAEAQTRAADCSSRPQSPGAAPSSSPVQEPDFVPATAAAASQAAGTQAPAPGPRSGMPLRSGSLYQPSA